MADYTLSAKGTYDGSNFNKGVAGSSSALDSFVGKCQGVGSKVTGALGKVASVGAKVTGVFAGLATGAFVKGGIDRALNIEQAKFKLGQLGMDVQSVMASASTAVDGTAFSLASAATSASLMGAAGVQAGDQMTKALQASAGVAAIGGVEMERVSQVFSKVAAAGKLQGDELMQLSEMGVNATSALAKHLGKTQAEVRDLVSKGEIDFQTFSDSMYETFGEAAYGANATFSGAMSNVRAALSRTSAKFADPALQALKGVFVALIPAINAVSSALDPAVASFTNFANAIGGRVVSGINEFVDALKESDSAAIAVAYGLKATFEGTALGGLFASTADSVGTFVQSMRSGEGVVKSLGSAASSFCSGMKTWIAEAFDGTPIGSFISWVTGCIDLFKMGGTPVEGFRLVFENLKNTVSSIGSSDGVASFVNGIKTKISELPAPIQPVVSALSSFGGFVASVFGRINVEGAGLAAAFGGVMALFGRHIGSAVGAVSSIGRVVGGAMSGLSGLVSAFMTAGGGIKGVTTLLGAFVSPVGLVVGAVAALAAGFVYLMTTNEGFRATVMDLVGQIGASLMPIIVIIGQALSNLASTVLPLVSNMIAMLLPVIGQIITVILQVLAALAPVVTMIVATLMPILTQLIQMIVAVAAQILAAVIPVITAIISAVQAALPVIQAIFTAVMAAVLAVINAVWPVIQAVVETVMNVIQSVIQIVTGVIEGDWDAVWNGIKSLFESIWNGIRSVVETALGVIQGAIDGALGVIQGAWNSAWDAVSTALSDCWEGIKTAVQDGVDAAYNTVVGIKDKITGFFDGAGRWLYDSGKAIIDGLAEGIRGAVGAATGAISGVLDQVRSFLPFSPAKIGPFSGKGWTLYSGQSISEALGKGVTRSGKNAVRAMSRVMGDMAEVAFSAPDFAYAGGYSYNVVSQVDRRPDEIDNRQSSVTINVSVDGDGKDAKDIASELYDLEQRASRRWSS